MPHRPTMTAPTKSTITFLSHSLVLPFSHTVLGGRDSVWLLSIPHSLTPASKGSNSASGGGADHWSKHVPRASLNLERRIRSLSLGRRHRAGGRAAERQPGGCPLDARRVRGGRFVSYGNRRAGRALSRRRMWRDRPGKRRGVGSAVSPRRGDAHKSTADRQAVTFDKEMRTQLTIREP